jgi:iron complex transport system ATP-binding protein
LQQWFAEDEEAVNRALAITEMTEFGDRPLDSLSGGQRQRAWIAMTLAQESMGQ